MRQILITEMERKTLFSLITKIIAQNFKGNFDMSEEERALVNDVLLYGVSHDEPTKWRREVYKLKSIQEHKEMEDE